MHFCRKIENGKGLSWLSKNCKNTYPIVLLGIVCMKQNNTIQRNKIDNLNHAFYYMKEIVEDEKANDYAQWSTKAERSYLLQDSIVGSTNRFGDYNEIRNFIVEISQIEDPAKADAKELLEQAEKMRVSWNTKNGKWSATIMEN